MKTEQEQIEKMARTMCGFCSTDGKCAVSRNLRKPEICADVDTDNCLYKEHAEQLVENGYGNVSEYKAEIERLRAENTTLYEVRNNLLEENDKLLKDNVALILDKRQVQIDMLNKAKKCSHCDNFFKDGKWHRYVFIDDIDELIKEVQNDKI